MNTAVTNKLCTSKLLRSVNTLTRRTMSEVKSDGIKIRNTDTPYVSPTSTLGDVHKVNGVERYFLVWTKKFKSVNEVPGYVSRDMMEKTRNIMRIRINLSIIAVCLVGALLAAKSGKKAAARGESLTKNNFEWHKEYNAAQNAQQLSSKPEN